MGSFRSRLQKQHPIHLSDSDPPDVYAPTTPTKSPPPPSVLTANPSLLSPTGRMAGETPVDFDLESGSHRSRTSEVPVSVESAADMGGRVAGGRVAGSVRRGEESGRWSVSLENEALRPNQVFWRYGSQHNSKSTSKDSKDESGALENGAKASSLDSGSDRATAGNIYLSVPYRVIPDDQ